MGAGVSARYVRSLGRRYTGRVSGRFGSTGVELEVGASRRLAHSASAGLYIVVGLTVRCQGPLPTCHLACC
jgi:DnaJ homolog subfamily C member 11